MPRYLVERTFPARLELVDDPQRSRAVVEQNAEAGAIWLHSYVAEGGRKTFDVYDAPSPEAIRKAAARNGLPIDSITAVRVLDPYSYAREAP